MHSAGRPSYWKKKIDPAFDLFDSIDDYRQAIDVERKDKRQHVDLLLKAGFPTAARSLRRCDGLDRLCDRGDCPVCKLQYDRALNAEVLELLAAHCNRGYLALLRIPLCFLSSSTRSDIEISHYHKLIHTKLDQGGYAGTRIIGSSRLAHDAVGGKWWFEMPIIIVGARYAHVGGLWDKLYPLTVESIRRIDPENLDISEMMVDFRAYSDRVEPYCAFGNGVDHPTPAQLFHLRWFSTMRLEDCVFRYGLAQVNAGQAS